MEKLSTHSLEEKLNLLSTTQLTEEEISEIWTELINDEHYLNYLKSIANLKLVIRKTEVESSS